MDIKSILNKSIDYNYENKEFNEIYNRYIKNGYEVSIKSFFEDKNNSIDLIVSLSKEKEEVLKTIHSINENNIIKNKKVYILDKYENEKIIKNHLNCKYEYIKTTNYNDAKNNVIRINESKFTMFLEEETKIYGMGLIKLLYIAIDKNYDLVKGAMFTESLGSIVNNKVNNLIYKENTHLAARYSGFISANIIKTKLLKNQIKINNNMFNEDFLNNEKLLFDLTKNANSILVTNDSLVVKNGAWNRMNKTDLEKIYNLDIQFKDEFVKNYYFVHFYNNSTNSRVIRSLSEEQKNRFIQTYNLKIGTKLRKILRKKMSYNLRRKILSFSPEFIINYVNKKEKK